MNQGETVLLIDWIIPSARGLRVHGFTRDSKYWHCCRIQVCLVPGCFPIIFNCFVNLYKNEPVSFSIVAFPSVSPTATKEGTVFATHSALSPNTKARAKLLPKASERPTRKPRRVYADCPALSLSGSKRTSCCFSRTTTDAAARKFQLKDRKNEEGDLAPVWFIDTCSLIDLLIDVQGCKFQNVFLVQSLYRWRQ